MPYVSLLRAINVGKKSAVNMGKLRETFIKLGYENVKTYINSGNVIFESSEKDEDKMVEKIEKGIEKDFGFKVRIVIRSKKEIEKICKEVPKEWVNNQEMKTDVLFLWNEVDHSKVIEDIDKNPEVDNLIYIKGAVVWNIDRKNYRKSKMHKFIGTHIYKNMTARNINTTRKIFEMMN